MNKMDNLLAFASQVAEQDRKEMERYVRFEKHIVPLVREKFKLKGFELQYRSMVSKEIQEFILNEDKKF